MQRLKLAGMLLIVGFVSTACCPAAFRCEIVEVKPPLVVPKYLMEPAENKGLSEALKDSQQTAPQTPHD